MVGWMQNYIRDQCKKQTESNWIQILPLISTHWKYRMHRFVTGLKRKTGDASETNSLVVALIKRNSPYVPCMRCVLHGRTDIKATSFWLMLWARSVSSARRLKAQMFSAGESWLFSFIKTNSVEIFAFFQVFFISSAKHTNHKQLSSVFKNK